jgi:hypothetical protein
LAAEVVSYSDDSTFILVGSTSSIGNGGFDGRVFDCNYNTYGNYSFDYQIGNSYDDFINGADTTYDKGIVVVGTTNETTFGYNSIFIHKVDSTRNSLSVYQEEVDLSAEIIEEDMLRIYPNPVKSTIYFKGQVDLGEQVRIFGLDGRMFLSKKLMENNIALPNDIIQGVYILEYKNVGYKLIVE